MWEGEFAEILIFDGDFDRSCMSYIIILNGWDLKHTVSENNIKISHIFKD
jgi:hypothetical protein